MQLNSVMLVPLMIKRKTLVKPVCMFVCSILAMILVPVITALSVKEEDVMALLIVSEFLVLLIVFIVFTIHLIKTALKQENSVFRFIPDAPDAAFNRTKIEFDFASAPGKVLYRDVSPKEIAQPALMVTLMDSGKVKGSDFSRITDIFVNHNYKVAMILKTKSGITPGGRYGVTGGAQFIWYIFVDEEYEKLMNAMNEHTVSVRTREKKDLEANYIVGGLRQRNLI